MNERPSVTLDELDEKVTQTFPGLVVRKDLLRRMRSSFWGNFEVISTHFYPFW